MMLFQPIDYFSWHLPLESFHLFSHENLLSRARAALKFAHSSRGAFEFHVGDIIVQCMSSLVFLVQTKPRNTALTLLVFLNSHVKVAHKLFFNLSKLI